MTQDEADEKIDKMPHVKQSTIPPSSYKRHGFDEYIPEVNGAKYVSVSQCYRYISY